MAFQVIARPAQPFVAPGARWHELEDENRVLGIELREEGNEIAEFSIRLASSRAEYEAEQSIAAELSRRARKQIVAETTAAAETTEELKLLQRSFAEVACAGAEARRVADLRAEGLKAADVTRQRLEEALEQAQMESEKCCSRSARIGERLAVEREERQEAVRRVEQLQSELSAASGQLMSRTTRVDALLRDKQRLWGDLNQLSRTQRPGRLSCGGSNEFAQMSRMPPMDSAAETKLSGPRPRSAPRPSKKSTLVSAVGVDVMRAKVPKPFGIPSKVTDTTSGSISACTPIPLRKIGTMAAAAEVQRQLSNVERALEVHDTQRRTGIGVHDVNRRLLR